jgi:hypothetical protein
VVKTLLITLALSAPPVTPGSTQDRPPDASETAILAVVDQFMVAVSTNDTAALSALRLEGGFNIVERPGEAGSTLITRRTFAPSTAKPGNYRERYWDPVVHVRGSIAVVWTPYEFWIDGKTSHCGIDVFDMMKEQGVWRIANMMWTVEPSACPNLRPADPSRIRPSR